MLFYSSKMLRVKLSLGTFRKSRFDGDNLRYAVKVNYNWL